MTTHKGKRSTGSKSPSKDETGDTGNEASGLSKTTEGEAMAEEKQTARPAKKSRARGHSSKKKAESKSETKSPTITMASEQPMPTAPQKKTSQYVVTIDNQSGLPVKIEKLDEETGARKELSENEYGQAFSSYSGLSPSLYGSLGSYVPASPAEAETMVQAYYQGVADYINALTSSR